MFHDAKIRKLPTIRHPGSEPDGDDDDDDGDGDVTGHAIVRGASHGVGTSMALGLHHHDLTQSAVLMTSNVDPDHSQTRPPPLPSTQKRINHIDQSNVSKTKRAIGAVATFTPTPMTVPPPKPQISTSASASSSSSSLLDPNRDPNREASNKQTTKRKVH